MWFLRGLKSKYIIDGRRVLGRENFPDDKQVSEQHVELRVEGTRMHVYDLGSMNGTYINELQLLPGVKGEIKKGQRLRIGKVELRAEFDADYVARPVDEPENESSGDYIWVLLGVLVFALVTLGYFSLPIMAYGRSIGTHMSLIVTGILFLSTILVAFPTAALCMRLETPWKRYAIFAAVLASGSVLVFNVILGVFDERWNISQEMLKTRVNYFCRDHYNERICGSQIRQCAACMEVLERFEAEKKASKQEIFHPQIPSALTRKPIHNPNAEIQ